MRVGILSDIHGNLEALLAVLEALHSPRPGGTAPEVVWCLGDLVGYGPDPNACVDFARRAGWTCVAGNHDAAAAGSAGLDTFNPSAASALEWTRAQLSPTNLAFLAGLPTKQTVEGVTLVHGSPRDPVWEYLQAEQDARENFDSFDGALCLVGHTHAPALFWKSAGGTTAKPLEPGIPRKLSEGRFIVNPGSVGQPRDGDARAAYAVLDLEQGSVTLFRVPYRVAVTQEKILSASLPLRLAARLSHGR